MTYHFVSLVLMTLFPIEYQTPYESTIETGQVLEECFIVACSSDTVDFGLLYLQSPIYYK